MNIKITIDESSDKSVNATMYTGKQDAWVNVGTLWMTQPELEDFVSVLTFGMADGCELIVDDPSAKNEYLGN